MKDHFYLTYLPIWFDPIIESKYKNAQIVKGPLTPRQTKFGSFWQLLTKKMCSWTLTEQM